MRRYDSYKDSFVEWLGEIPSNWEVYRLKYVAESNPSNVDKKSKEDEIQVLLCNYVDVYKNEFISSSLDFMTATASRAQVEKFKLEKGDVIATKDSESADDIAIPALVSEDMPNVVCGYHLNHIKPKFIRGEYLFRLFQTPYLRSYFEVAANGVTRYGIGAEKFANVEILLPPLPEQTAIANYLDRKTAEIDQLIADKKRLLELYEEEKTAIINQAVTKGLDPNVPMKDSGIEWIGEIPKHWEVKRLKYLLSSIVGGGTPSTTNSLYWDGNIPWVSAKDIKQDFIFSSTDYITELAIRESATNFIEDERIIIVVRSGILKHTFPVAINKVPLCINQDLKALKPTKSVLIDFMFWSLKGLSKEILTVCNKMGATVDSIELNDLMNLPCCYPTIQEQEDIVKHIILKSNRFSQKICKTQKLIDLLTEYRTALISEVVTGKIKVTT